MHVWKLHTEPQVQWLLNCVAHNSVHVITEVRMSILLLWLGKKGQVLEMPPQKNQQSFNTRVPRTDSSEVHTESWWLHCRNRPGQEQGHERKGNPGYVSEMPDRVRSLKTAGWIWNSLEICTELQWAKNWTKCVLLHSSFHVEEILVVFKIFTFAELRDEKGEAGVVFTKVIEIEDGDFF